MKRKLIAVILAIFAGATQAQPYVSAGVSHLSSDLGGLEHATVAIGYKLFKHVALEVGAFQPGSLGEVTSNVFSILAPDTVQSQFSKGAWDVHGFRASALFSWPLTPRATAFAVVSAYRVKSRFQASSNEVLCVGVSPNVVCNLTDATSSGYASRKTLPGIGLGFEYAFTESFSARLSVERIKAKPGMFGAGNDIGDFNSRTLDFVVRF